MAFTLDTFNNISSGAAKGPKLFSYSSSSDTLATIIADDYFLDVNGALSADDLIYIVGSDGSGWYKVLSASSGTVTLGTSAGDAYRRVTIPSADVLTLRANPYELVPAPGSGKMLVFERAMLQLDYNSSGYTESNDNMTIRYTDGSGVEVSDAIEATGFIDQTADTTTTAVPVKDAIVANSSALNQPLVLDNTGDGEYASGDSPLVVDIYYKVINGV